MRRWSEVPDPPHSSQPSMTDAAQNAGSPRKFRKSPGRATTDRVPRAWLVLRRSRLQPPPQRVGRRDRGSGERAGNLDALENERSESLGTTTSSQLSSKLISPCERTSSESGHGFERGKYLDRVFPISGDEFGSRLFVNYNDANLHLVRVFISV